MRTMLGSSVFAMLILVIATWFAASHHVHAVALSDEDAMPASASAPLAANRCEAIEKAALDECTQMMEDTWYFGGAVDYMHKPRERDYPRCERLSTNLYHVCNADSR